MGHRRFAPLDLGLIFQGATVSGLSESQLLERYLQNRDEVAFEALVARHGPMVLGVCRRMLRNETDVEDAFQATFLVLVRRGRGLGPRDAIGPWLYGVATRVALRSRSESARQRRLGRTRPDVVTTHGDHDAEHRELGEALDQELSRLPSKYRHPIVLCYLEGRTHEEAARQLNWPIGTVKGRLARARELLQSRLARRGITPAVGAVALNLSFRGESWASVHQSLVHRTVRLGVESAIRPAALTTVSASITSLVEGVLTSMLLNTVKWTGTGVLVGGLALGGIAVMARQTAGPAQTKPNDTIVVRMVSPPANAVKAPIPKKKTEETTGLRTEASPIDDARKNLVKAASVEWEEARKLFAKTSIGSEQAYEASKRLMGAERLPDEKSDNNGKPEQRHLERIRELCRLQQSSKPATPELESARLRSYAAEATLRVAEADATKVGKHQGRSSGGKGSQEHDSDPKSQMILSMLDEPVSMSFVEDTPLEDVLKYVKQATTSSTYGGIQIYVDPLGLQEAEKSMNSTVRNMGLEGVPLRRTLQLLLKQLDLMYFVDDGVLCITSAKSKGHFDQAMQEPSPILQKAEKAERGEISLAEMKDLIELFKTREEIRKLAAGEVKDGPRTAQSRDEEVEAKQRREQMDQLLKEVRELIQVLKAQKQTQTGGVSK